MTDSDYLFATYCGDIDACAAKSEAVLREYARRWAPELRRHPRAQELREYYASKLSGVKAGSA